MKKSKKEAKFFCESCGSEVPGRAKVCPVCGKFFASVRCPKCGRTGNSDDFKNGCPTCGYAVKPEDLYDDDGYDYNVIGFKHNKKAGRKSRNALLDLLRSKSDSDSKAYDSSLPIWVYIFTVLVLVILIICLYSCL